MLMLFPLLTTLLLASPQALPPPRDGDIRVLYWELRNETEVWLTLEPKLVTGAPPPPLMNLTFTLHFPGKRPKAQPDHVEMRAYTGLLWAPKIELWIMLDGGEKIDLAPQGMVGLDNGVPTYLPAPLPVATLKRMADAKRIRINALGLEFELSESERQAVRAFVDRVLSDNPGQFSRQP